MREAQEVITLPEVITLADHVQAIATIIATAQEHIPIIRDRHTTVRVERLLLQHRDVRPPFNTNIVLRFKDNHNRSSAVPRNNIKEAYLNNTREAFLPAVVVAMAGVGEPLTDADTNFPDRPVYRGDFFCLL